MAEGDGLLNRYRVNALSRVRIPLPPPLTFSKIGVETSLNDLVKITRGILRGVMGI